MASNFHLSLKTEISDNLWGIIPLGLGAYRKYGYSYLADKERMNGNRQNMGTNDYFKINWPKTPESVKTGTTAGDKLISRMDGGRTYVAPTTKLKPRNQNR